jgi:hypothetical protein
MNSEHSKLQFIIFREDVLDCIYSIVKSIEDDKIQTHINLNNLTTGVNTIAVPQIITEGMINNGISGGSGTSGTSGADGSFFGSSGTSGTSGTFAFTGTTDNGLLTLNGSLPNVTVESNLNFNGSILTITGDVEASKYYITALNTAPANATDTGKAGEIRIDASHIYICTATNTWKRVAISTW